VQYFVREPRVSVVIVNWNYARYVADAIRSVKRQTYRNFECLVIDNASSDDSAAVIVDAIAGDPQFTFHRLPENLGHLGASLWSLDRLDGEFVTFLDADDVLFPGYLLNHLQAHLSTAWPTGFTSSVSIEVNAAGMQLTAGFCYVHHIWRSGVPALRPIERIGRLEATDAAAYSGLAEATRYVSADVHGWLWHPGSSNMFRRALLERLRPRLASPKAFGGVDGFYLPVLHAVTGTNLIDLPLSAYRLHGKNDFSRLPALMYMRTGHAKAEAQSAAVSRLVLISLIDGFDNLPTDRERLWTILEVAASNRMFAPFNDAEIKAAFGRQYPALVRHFGERRAIRELRRWMTYRDLLEIALRSRRGTQRFATIRRTLAIATRHHIGRTLKKAPG
jgi:glycosyltransferase involved in cell wall biosynthesis